MKAKTDPNVRHFASLALSKQVKAIQSEIGNVRASQDIEAIHRTRVATRRLGVLLTLFEDHFPKKTFSTWQSHFRAIRQAMGAARDADVQIEFIQNFMQTLAEPRYRPGLQRLLLRIQQNRAAQQEKVLKIIKKVESHSWLEKALKKLDAAAAECPQPCPFSASLYRLAQAAITEHLDDLFAHQKALSQLENSAELHAMRVAAKHLRYTLETFAPLYPDGLKSTLQNVRKIQELLGDIHDRDVWLLFLPEFLEQERRQASVYFGHTRPINRLVPGIQHFQLCLSDERQKSDDLFRQQWRDWQNEGAWDEVRAIIDRPLNITAEPFPPPQDPQLPPGIIG